MCVICESWCSIVYPCKMYWCLLCQRSIENKTFKFCCLKLRCHYDFSQIFSSEPNLCLTGSLLIMLTSLVDCEFIKTVNKLSLSHVILTQGITCLPLFLSIHHQSSLILFLCSSICVSQGGSCWKETTLPCCRVWPPRTMQSNPNSPRKKYCRPFFFC